MRMQQTGGAAGACGGDQAHQPRVGVVAEPGGQVTAVGVGLHQHRPRPAGRHAQGEGGGAGAALDRTDGDQLLIDPALAGPPHAHRTHPPNCTSATSPAAAAMRVASPDASSSVTTVAPDWSAAASTDTTVAVEAAADQSGATVVTLLLVSGDATRIAAAAGDV